MKRALLSLLFPLLPLLLLLGCLSSLNSPTHEQKITSFINNVYSPSVGLMYNKTDSVGGRRFVCTATAFSRAPEGFLFVSASHCVTPMVKDLYMSPDSTGPEIFYRAVPIAYGNLKVDADFSVIYVEANPTAFQIIPLGKDPSQISEKVFDISAPMGLGKVYTEGVISLTKIQRHLTWTYMGETVDWQGNIFFQSPGDYSGSSGSALICENQLAVCGIMIGSVENGFVAKPISEFKIWWAGIRSGEIEKYPALPPPPPINPFADFLKTLDTNGKPKSK